MELEQIGGQLTGYIVPARPKEKRHKYPCTLCIRFNTAHCDRCKCDTCQVPEEKCPQCKNRPTDLSTYQIIHGTPQKGENWDSADHFKCTRCYGLWKVKWSQLPKYDQCPRCRTVYYLHSHFTGLWKGCLRGAHKPGINVEKLDYFKCPSCGSHFQASHASLPSNLTCRCGRTYYCYKSPEEKVGLERLRFF